jgi:signal peptidase I
VESPLEAPTLPADASPEAPVSPPSRSRRSNLFREIVETALLTAIIFLIVNAATGRFKIDGQSMEPNLHDGEYVIVDKISYLLGRPQRGDVIVFYREGDPKDYIKRVIGLPGEIVEGVNGMVFVNGQPLDEPYTAPGSQTFPSLPLGADEYFVMGDNRGNSQDSRSFGPIHTANIVGRAWIIYWPPTDWAIVPHHTFAAAQSP